MPKEEPFLATSISMLHRNPGFGGPCKPRKMGHEYGNAFLAGLLASFGLFKYWLGFTPSRGPLAVCDIQD